MKTYKFYYYVFRGSNEDGTGHYQSKEYSVTASSLHIAIKDFELNVRESYDYTKVDVISN